MLMLVISLTLLHENRKKMRDGDGLNTAAITIYAFVLFRQTDKGTLQRRDDSV